MADMKETDKDHILDIVFTLVMLAGAVVFLGWKMTAGLWLLIGAARLQFLKP